MNSRFINWIWHVRGSLELAPGQSGKDAFEKLDPFFRQSGTSYDRTSDTLTFSKKNQAAQDKMSVFDGGVLQVEQGTDGNVLHYHLISRALLFCFLAPLLFLGFAQLTVFVGDLEKQSKEASEALKKPEKKDEELQLHPIDIALGAPAPEKPDKDEKKKGEEEDEGPSPTPAYVFAAIFAALYVVGRILEAWLVKARFRKSLLGT
ncbi:MAG: hypothetical protein ABWZ75_06290 [Novosphingobium sp.]